MHGDEGAGVRIDKGDEYLVKKDVAYFSYPFSGTYRVYVQTEYSDPSQQQYNESFFLRFWDDVPHDANAGDLYIVQDENQNTIKWVDRRYAGTWTFKAHRDYQVDLHHYYTVKDLYPQFKNEREWSVDSVHIYSIILERVK
jgi:hypothetical protein